MTTEEKRLMDIVESLRRATEMPDCPNPLAQKEAADEIERLRKQWDEYRQTS